MWCLNIDTCALGGVFMFVCMLYVSICLCVCIFCVHRSYLHVSVCASTPVFVWRCVHLSICEWYLLVHWHPIGLRWPLVGVSAVTEQS